MSRIEIVGAESSDLFVDSSQGIRQVVRVRIKAAAGADRALVVIRSPDGRVRSQAVPVAGDETERMIEIPVEVSGVVAGDVLACSVEVEGRSEPFPLKLAVEEPGWTMYMVSHFHYDPVWYTTQAAYTEYWDFLRQPEDRRYNFSRQGETAQLQLTGMSLVRTHLEEARRDPLYKFVMAEIDYLKPYLMLHPEDRSYVQQLLKDGRLELVGGTYNEPNTNLTTLETTIRNFIYGIGFQRGILGGHPRIAWQLDVSGHEPQFPALACGAGLDAATFARGPHHEWGPAARPHPLGRHRRSLPWDHRYIENADISNMQFPSEFEWIGPSGTGLLTHYMPDHYGAGWRLDDAVSIDEACNTAYRLFSELKRVAASKNVLLPVGVEWNPPNKWMTAVEREWNRRYASPRFVSALPSEFTDAVRAERQAGAAITLAPQTRDMNPVYTGKDVSFIDTKQAQRAAETLLADAERFAVIAAWWGFGVPAASIDMAWRQLVYGAHHDAINGTESDQVYIDLMGGWRQAWQIARDVLQSAQDYLAAGVPADPAGSTYCVFNPSSWRRTDVIGIEVGQSAPAQDQDGGGKDTSWRVTDLESAQDVPVVVEEIVTGEAGARRHVLLFSARDVPATGYRTYRVLRTDVRSGAGARWEPAATNRIENEHFIVSVDASQGGCIAELSDKIAGRSLLSDGGLANELVVYDEYVEDHRWQEGPWHLLPTGVQTRSGSTSAQVACETSELGQRLRISGAVAGIGYTQQITLWRDSRLVCFETRLLDFAERDKLVRVRFAADVPGGLPVSEVGAAVIGRGFGLPNIDSAGPPWTLDNAATNWFGLSHMASIQVTGTDGTQLHRRAMGVAEIVVPGPEFYGMARPLLTALVEAGITATCSTAAGNRYGELSVDSNLPDIRICVGDESANAFAARLLAEAATYRDCVIAAAKSEENPIAFIPASRPLRSIWSPGAVVTGYRDLPVLLLARASDEAVAWLVDQVRSGTVRVIQDEYEGNGESSLEDYTVAVLNRGTPGFAIDGGGSSYLSLIRSCTGWPSGVWTDEPRRTSPDGSPFMLEHWSHRFEYALAAGPGDWRDSDMVRLAQEYNHDLTARAGSGSSPLLPLSGSFLAVKPDSIVCTALKPAGNPLAFGDLGDASDGGEVVLRCYETLGRPTRARISSMASLADPATVNLLEEAVPGGAQTDGDEVIWEFGPNSVQSLRLHATAGANADKPVLKPSSPAIPARPVATRYWLHNTGPAPVGGQLTSVFVQPRAAMAAEQIVMSVKASSELRQASWLSRVDIAVPAGWTCSPASRSIMLPPAGSFSFEAVLIPKLNDPAGRYFVSVQAMGADGRTYEDVLTVHLGGRQHAAALAAPGVGPADGPAELSIAWDNDQLDVRPGLAGIAQLVLENHARTGLHGEVQVISPWETWPFTGPSVQEFEVAALGKTTVSIEVSPPGTEPEGSYWLLAKVTYFGRVRYTETIPLRVGQQ